MKDERNPVKVNVLGVPDSAGAYCVGVEHAPAALREATIELADAASRLLDPDAKLLVLGGSCVTALGMCAALADADEQPRLVYIDRHLDLNTPRSTTEGSLSWMGMAHALNVDGASRALADATGRAPLLRADDLVYLGVDTTRETTDGERAHLEALGPAVVMQQELCDDPQRAAQTARGHLDAGPFAVHLDVDVLDFLDAPLAENVNGRNSGPTIAQLAAVLAELLPDPDCRGLTIGQLVPAHAASDPTALPRFIDALATALSTAR
jgi:arginase